MDYQVSSGQEPFDDRQTQWSEWSEWEFDPSTKFYTRSRENIDYPEWIQWDWGARSSQAQITSTVDGRYQTFRRPGSQPTISGNVNYVRSDVPRTSVPGIPKQTYNPSYQAPLPNPYQSSGMPSSYLGARPNNYITSSQPRNLVSPNSLSYSTQISQDGMQVLGSRDNYQIDDMSEDIARISLPNSTRRKSQIYNANDNHPAGSVPLESDRYTTRATTAHTTSTQRDPDIQQSMYRSSELPNSQVDLVSDNEYSEDDESVENQEENIMPPSRTNKTEGSRSNRGANSGMVGIESAKSPTRKRDETNEKLRRPSATERNKSRGSVDRIASSNRPNKPNKPNKTSSSKMNSKSVAKASGTKAGASREITTARDVEFLDPEFRVWPSKEFIEGRVFMVLWSEPHGAGDKDMNASAITYDETQYVIVKSKLGQEAYHSIRRFVIAKGYKGHSLCLPILTYNRQGTSKNGAKAEDHAVIYTGDTPPQQLDGEQIRKRPIRMTGFTQRDKLVGESRVNYAKIYTIEHNVKVKFIGMIHDDDVNIFFTDYDRTHTRLEKPERSAKKEDAKGDKKKRK